MRLSAVVVALVLTVTVAGSASAPRAAFADPETLAPVTSLATIDPFGAVDILRSGDFRRAIDATAPGRVAIAGDVRPADDRLRRLGLVHVVARGVRFLVERDGEQNLEQLLQLAAARARPEDLPLLRALERCSPRAAPFARALARRAGEKITGDLDARTLLAFLRSDDAATRRHAIAALGERVARLHDRIDAGGDLTVAEQAEISDPALVAALADALDERHPELDVLPHDLAAEASPSALHVLALIETPAIPVLEDARRNGVEGAEAALDAIHEAAVIRLRRHPRSSWSSARGLIPALVPGSPVCLACGRPEPLGAHFCPSCGNPSPVTACPRCGGPMVGGLCPRCGGSGDGEARRCDKCQEPVGALDRFCHRCGARTQP